MIDTILNKTKDVYKIVERDTGKYKGSYERGNYTKEEFSSVEEARHSNCHGVFEDKGKYRIQKFRVTYELIEDEAD